MAFESIKGQEQACRVLASALECGRVPHAYLFTGPDGVGKRTTAIQWAQILNCSSRPALAAACGVCASCRKIQDRLHPDVLWIGFDHQARLLGEDVKKQRALKIDTVRDMERVLHLRALEGRVKIAFVDPAERLVEEAGHALLKILEEPPPGTHVALLAVDARHLLPTLRSRCQWVRFGPLPAAVVAEELRRRRPDLSEEDARAWAVRSEGSLGQALALLEDAAAVSLDWENVPLSEVLSWCEQFQRARLGRDAAETFLRSLLAEFQVDLRGGRRSPEDLRLVLDALHQLKQNVTPQLILEVVLLKLRWKKRQLSRREASPALR
jgi:DNA polymerase III subunit delta'